MAELEELGGSKVVSVYRDVIGGRNRRFTRFLLPEAQEEERDVLLQAGAFGEPSEWVPDKVVEEQFERQCVDAAEREDFRDKVNENLAYYDEVLDLRRSRDRRIAWGSPTHELDDSGLQDVRHSRYDRLQKNHWMHAIAGQHLAVAGELLSDHFFAIAGRPQAFGGEDDELVLRSRILGQYHRDVMNILTRGRMIPQPSQIIECGFFTYPMFAYEPIKQIAQHLREPDRMHLYRDPNNRVEQVKQDREYVGWLLADAVRVYFVKKEEGVWVSNNERALTTEDLRWIQALKKIVTDISPSSVYATIPNTVGEFSDKVSTEVMTRLQEDTA